MSSATGLTAVKSGGEHRGRSVRADRGKVMAVEKKKGFHGDAGGGSERALPRQRRRRNEARANVQRMQGKMQIIVMSYCIFGIDATPCLLAAWQRWPSWKHPAKSGLEFPPFLEHTRFRKRCVVNHRAFQTNLSHKSCSILSSCQVD